MLTGGKQSKDTHFKIKLEVTQQKLGTMQTESKVNK